MALPEITKSTNDENESRSGREYENVGIQKQLPIEQKVSNYSKRAAVAYILLLLFVGIPSVIYFISTGLKAPSSCFS